MTFDKIAKKYGTWFYFIFCCRLDDTLRDLIGQLQDTDTKDLDERCERMQDIVDHVLSLVSWNWT